LRRGTGDDIGRAAQKGENQLEFYFTLVLAPFLAVFLGCSLGAVFACMIAPGDFLRGPLGRKWLNFIGTRNLLLARFVSLIVFALVLSLILVVVKASIMEFQQPASK
jgi:hypothetical protein